MKKTYFAPALKVVNVQVQHIMAGSGVELDASGNVESVGFAETNYNGGAVLDKGGESLWDED